MANPELASGSSSHGFGAEINAPRLTAADLEKFHVAQFVDTEIFGFFDPTFRVSSAGPSDAVPIGYHLRVGRVAHGAAKGTVVHVFVNNDDSVYPFRVGDSSAITIVQPLPAAPSSVSLASAGELARLAGANSPNTIEPQAAPPEGVEAPQRVATATPTPTAGPVDWLRRYLLVFAVVLHLALGAFVYVNGLSAFSIASRAPAQTPPNSDSSPQPAPNPKAPIICPAGYRATHTWKPKWNGWGGIGFTWRCAPLTEFISRENLHASLEDEVKGAMGDFLGMSRDEIARQSILSVVGRMSDRFLSKGGVASSDNLQKLVDAIANIQQLTLGYERLEQRIWEYERSRDDDLRKWALPLQSQSIRVEDTLRAMERQQSQAELNLQRAMREELSRGTKAPIALFEKIDRRIVELERDLKLSLGRQMRTVESSITDLANKAEDSARRCSEAAISVKKLWRQGIFDTKTATDAFLNMGRFWTDPAVNATIDEWRSVFEAVRDWISPLWYIATLRGWGLLLVVAVVSNFVLLGLKCLRCFFDTTDSLAQLGMRILRCCRWWLMSLVRLLGLVITIPASILWGFIVALLRLWALSSTDSTVGPSTTPSNTPRSTPATSANSGPAANTRSRGRARDAEAPRRRPTRQSSMTAQAVQNAESEEETRFTASQRRRFRKRRLQERARSLTADDTWYCRAASRADHSAPPASRRETEDDAEPEAPRIAKGPPPPKNRVAKGPPPRRNPPRPRSSEVPRPSAPTPDSAAQASPAAPESSKMAEQRNPCSRCGTPGHHDSACPLRRDEHERFARYLYELAYPTSPKEQPSSPITPKRESDQKKFVSLSQRVAEQYAQDQEQRMTWYHVHGHLDEQPSRVSFLVDSGSQISILPSKLCKRFGWEVHSETPGQETHIQGVNGAATVACGRLTLLVKIGKTEIPVEFVVSSTSQQIILGGVALKDFGFALDFTRDRIRTRDGQYIYCHVVRASKN